MTLSAIGALGLITSLIGTIVAAAMLALVVWQAPRNSDNRLMALYQGALIMWLGSNLLARMAALLGYDPTTLVYWNFFGAALAALVLFAFITHYAHLWQLRWVKVCLVIGGITVLAFGFFLFRGWMLSDISISPSGLFEYHLTLPGLLFFVVANSYFLLGLFITLKYRHTRAGKLWPGQLVLMLGIVTILSPTLRPYAVATISATISSVLLAYAILRDNLFNPMVELNRELQQRQAELSALIENTEDSLWSVDTDCCLITSNSTFKRLFRLAYGVDLRRGLPILEQLPPDQRAAWQSFYGRALNGERFAFEQHFDFAGLALDVEVSMNPILADDGRITGVAVFSRNITERKRA